MKKITIPENLQAELMNFNNQKLSDNAMLENSDASQLISSYSTYKEKPV